MSRRVQQRPPTPSESEEEEEEDDEEVDPTEKIQALPLEQRRRVYALKAIVNSTREAQRKKRTRIAELERQFREKMEPLYELRRKIIAGEHEPNEEEVKRGDKPEESKVEEIASDDEDDKKKAKEEGKKGVKIVAPKDTDEADVLARAAARPDGGIPAFWLTALKNNEVTEGMVMPRDEEALRALQNVTSEFVDNDPLKGFKLTFTFGENAFFTNKVLTKTYLMDPEDEEEYTLDDVQGTEIAWTSPANKLTVVMKEKKQRHKSGKGVRVVTREEKCPSFFHFFDPPKVPKSDDEAEQKEDEDEEDDVDEQLQMDFEIGQAFHESIVPRAVYYYTGESIADMAAGMMGGEFDDDDEDDDDEEEDESEEEAVPAGKRGRGGAAGGARGGRGGQECKQQ